MRALQQALNFINGEDQDHVWRSFQAYPLCQHTIGLAQTSEAPSDRPQLTQILRSDVGFTFLCFLCGSPSSFSSLLSTIAQRCPSLRELLVSLVHLAFCLVFC